MKIEIEYMEDEKIQAAELAHKLMKDENTVYLTPGYDGSDSLGALNDLASDLLKDFKKKGDQKD